MLTHKKSPANTLPIEKHPLDFFLPANACILFLGSFPPPAPRWSMQFYYPNFTNDFWRLQGLIFFADKDYFILPGKKAFDREKIIDFCESKGIALGDTAVRIIRHKGNASDLHLEVVEPLDLSATLQTIPQCQAIVITGQKAMDTLLELLHIPEPQIGAFTSFEYEGRLLKLFRMPSTSRAYPKPLAEKAGLYAEMYKSLNMI